MSDLTTRVNLVRSLSTTKELPVSTGAKLLGINRTSVYYGGLPVSQEELECKSIIDHLHTDNPTWGARQMSAQLKLRGYQVGRRKASRYMREMDITPIYPKMNLSKRMKQAKVCPYLLRNAVIDRPNQAWSIDITYIPMKHGFLYLTAIIDWYSRCIVGWDVDDTLDTTMVINACKKAFKVAKPLIINSDQGSQFTSDKYIDFIRNSGIRQSIADALLGANRTIILADENTKIEKLAFDINHKRISPINTDNKNFYRTLSEWIIQALEESDKQRFTRRYIIEEFASDVVSVVNYFYRMSYYSDATYSAGLQIPTVDQIESELSKTKIGMYAAEVDFSTIIQILEQKLQKLMDFTHPRAVWHILNLISSIKDYQLYCNSIQYRHLNIIDEGKEQYGLYDKKTFFLKPGNNVGEIKGSVFFNKNTIICQNMNCSIVLDKRWTVKDDANFKVQNIVLDNGTEQTAVVMKIATYAEVYRRYLATYIHGILEAVNGLIDYCELEMVHIGNDGKETGIITLILQ